MKKQIDGLRPKSSWVTHLGCVHGCLEHLGVSMSPAWLHGGTGHAFIINIHEVVCPSGPTAWHTHMLGDLGRNLGYREEGIFADKPKPDFREKQEAAWAHVRECIDEGIPCYGWELHIPEFYTIHGYDEVGYYCLGPGRDDDDGPVPWEKVGDTGIGVLEMYSVHPCEPAPDEKTVKEALAFAVEHAGNPKKWVYPKYHAGPKGFRRWAKALEEGTASRFGQGYNGAVWAECRGHAVGFLKEAGKRLGGKADDLFDEALECYSSVHGKLEALSELHPFKMSEPDAEEETLKSLDGAALLREAAAAEAEGLAVLEQIVEAL